MAVRPHEGDRGTTQLLLEDAELAEWVPPVLRAQAIEDCVVQTMSLIPGPWRLPQPLGPDAIGFVVLSGVMIRRLAIDGRRSVELVGDGDILRPWQDGDAPTVNTESSWQVLTPTRLARLDGSFTRRLGLYPELGGALFERVVRRSRDLVTTMAIAHHPRVDARLHLLLWQLAGRWGRVRGDGVYLPIRLTHMVLADLVAARRPTVTSALSELAARGEIEVREDGWLLKGDSPRQLEQR